MMVPKTETKKKAKTTTFFPFLDNINTVDELDELIKHCQRKKKDIFEI